jgi:hypothetical protein
MNFVKIPSSLHRIQPLEQRALRRIIEFLDGWLCQLMLSARLVDSTCGEVCGTGAAVRGCPIEWGLCVTRLGAERKTPLRVTHRGFGQTGLGIRRRQQTLRPQVIQQISNL